MRQKNLLSANLFLVIISTVFFGSFFVTNSVLASHTTAVCETNTMKNGSFCNWTDSNSWCGGNTLTCQLEPDSATTPPAGVTGGSWNFCNSCSWTLTCNGGFTKCAGNNTCVATQNCLAGQTFDACSNTCLGSAATLKLAYDSAGGTYLVNSPAPVLSILSTGKVGLGTTAPNDLFSIGGAGLSAPAGSADTGHNFTSTYLGSDDYALTNYGLVKSLISSATSSSALWGGIMGGNVWNLNSGNVGIGTTNPTSLLHLFGSGVKLKMSDSLLTLGLASEATGQLIDYGTNFDQLGNRNSAYAGGFFRIDTRIGVESQFFNIKFVPAGGTEQTIFRVTTTGDLVNSGTIKSDGVGNSSFAGNVGIGLTNPGEKLQVAGGNISATKQYAQLMLGIQNSDGDVHFGSSGNGAPINGTQDYGFYAAHNAYRGDDGNWYHSRTATIPAVRFSGGGGASSGLSGFVWSYASNQGAAAIVWTDLMKLTTSGKLGVGTTVPNDTFSIGNAGAAPAGSSATGHNFTNSYIGTDDYALANYGLVKTLINSATSSSALWGGATGSNVWNLNSGNVGIGITAPTQKLQVNGNIFTTGNLFMNTSGGSTGIGWYMPSYYTWYDYMKSGGGIGPNGLGAPTDVASGVTGWARRFNIESNGTYGWIFEAGANSTSSAPTVKFAINSGTGTFHSTGNGLIDGSVGIGTTNPGAKLEINTTGEAMRFGDGTSGSSPYISFNGRGFWGQNGSGEILMQIGSSRPFNIAHSAVGFGAGLTSRLYINTAGNVGVGTIAPNDKLSIGNAGVAAPAGSADTGHNFTNSYIGTDKYALANYGLVESLINSATSSSALWGGAVGGNVWSLNSGNVGIGTTTPAYKLDVNGQLRITGNAFFDAGNFVKDQNSTVDSMWGWYAWDKEFQFNKRTLANVFVQNIFTANWDTGNLALVPNAGNVGIGTTNPGKLLTISKSDASGMVGSNNSVIRLVNPGTTLGEFTGLQFNFLNDIDAQTTAMIGAVLTDKTSSWRSDIVFGTKQAGGSEALTEYMRISSGGNVGIGTTGPVGKLDILAAGSATQSAISQIASNGGVMINSNYVNNNYYPMIGVRMNDNNPTIVNAGMFAQFTNSGSNILIGGSNLYSAGFNPSLFIQYSGNVGIGTTAPNDIFSIGNAGAAPAGSSGTGHNFTSSYVGTDDYALANYGVVKTLIASVASARSVFVGLSATAYNGNNSGSSGYAYAYARCAADQAGAHVCTPDEILNTIAIGGTMPAEDAWIFAGPPGYTAAANDCEGRSVATTAARGTYWQKADVPSGRLQGRGLLLLCDQTLKLACCR